MPQPETRRWGRILHSLLLQWMLGLAGPAFGLPCAPWVPPTSEAADTTYTDGLLWRVTSPAGKVSHLFGTIHLDAEQVGQPDTQISALVRASREVWLELALDEGALAQVAGFMSLPADSSLRQLVGDDIFEAATTRLRRYGIPAETAQHLQPWAVYTTLNLPPGQQGAPLDLVLDRLARAGGIPVHGLESLAEQAGVFSGIPRTDLLDLLVHTLCHQERIDDATRKLVKAYRAGDLKTIVEAAAAHESPAEARLRPRLLEDRNRRMASRLREPLLEGGVLAAIGALHLSGRQGVLARLARAGFRLEPVLPE